jgi:hypothetical protein
MGPRVLGDGDTRETTTDVGASSGADFATPAAGTSGTQSLGLPSSRASRPKTKPRTQQSHEDEPEYAEDGDGEEEEAGVDLVGNFENLTDEERAEPPEDSEWEEDPLSQELEIPAGYSADDRVAVDMALSKTDAEIERLLQLREKQRERKASLRAAARRGSRPDTLPATADAEHVFGAVAQGLRSRGVT